MTAPDDVPADAGGLLVNVNEDGSVALINERPVEGSRGVLVPPAARLELALALVELELQARAQEG